MPNPGDLTTAELMEFIENNPQLRTQIAESDPRVKLMEKLDADPEAHKAIRVHSKRLFPNARVLELDLPAEYEEKLKARDEKIEKLEKRLNDGEASTRYERFRTALREHAEALDESPEDKDLDEIIAFMRDNDYGEKSAGPAVAAFYRTKAPATPNLTENNPLAPAATDAFTKKLFAAGPSDDLMALAMPDIERIFHEEFTGSPTKRRPQMA